MKTLPEKRRKALYEWACEQDEQTLASLLVNVLSNKDIKLICENEDIEIRS